MSRPRPPRWATTESRSRSWPDFAPGADAVLVDATIPIQGHTIGGRAIYVLRGTTFFGFSDLVLDGAPPSAADVKAEAMTLLGRLP